MQRLTTSVALLSRPSSPPQTTPQPTYPGKAELLQALPPELMRFNPVKAWGSLALSLGLSLLAYGVGTQIPLQLWATPLWLLYGAITEIGRAHV